MRDGQAVRVLVVDDDPSMCEILQLRLERSGASVSTAHDGQEALALIDDLNPDVVVTDWRMTPLDGVCLCRQIRTHRSLDHTHLVMLSGESSQDGVDALRDIRDVTYIEKGCHALDSVIKAAHAVWVTA